MVTKPANIHHPCSHQSTMSFLFLPQSGYSPSSTSFNYPLASFESFLCKTNKAQETAISIFSSIAIVYLSKYKKYTQFEFFSLMLFDA